MKYITALIVIDETLRYTKSHFHTYILALLFIAQDRLLHHPPQFGPHYQSTDVIQWNYEYGYLIGPQLQRVITDLNNGLPVNWCKVLTKTYNTMEYWHNGASKWDYALDWLHGGP